MAAAGAGGEDEAAAVFKSDAFCMYLMKIVPCSKRFSHDWLVCPFSHPGEKATRCVAWATCLVVSAGWLFHQLRPSQAAVR